jgi:hypothetical protein
VPVGVQNLPSCLQLSSSSATDSARSSDTAAVTIAETLARTTGTSPTPQQPRRSLTTSASSNSSRMSNSRRGSTFWVPALGTLTLQLVLLQPTAGRYHHTVLLNSLSLCCYSRQRGVRVAQSTSCWLYKDCCNIQCDTSQCAG